MEPASNNCLDPEKGVDQQLATPEIVLADSSESYSDSSQDLDRDGEPDNANTVLIRADNIHNKMATICRKLSEAVDQNQIPIGTTIQFEDSKTGRTGTIAVNLAEHRRLSSYSYKDTEGDVITRAFSGHATGRTSSAGSTESERVRSIRSSIQSAGKKSATTDKAPSICGVQSTVSTLSGNSFKHRSSDQKLTFTRSLGLVNKVQMPGLSSNLTVLEPILSAASNIFSRNISSVDVKEEPTMTRSENTLSGYVNVNASSDSENMYSISRIGNKEIEKEAPMEILLPTVKQMKDVLKNNAASAVDGCMPTTVPLNFTFELSNRKESTSNRDSVASQKKAPHRKSVPIKKGGRSKYKKTSVLSLAESNISLLGGTIEEKAAREQHKNQNGSKTYISTWAMGATIILLFAGLEIAMSLGCSFGLPDFVRILLHIIGRISQIIVLLSIMITTKYCIESNNKQAVASTRSSRHPSRSGSRSISMNTNSRRGSNINSKTTQRLSVNSYITGTSADTLDLSKNSSNRTFDDNKSPRARSPRLSYSSRVDVATNSISPRSSKRARDDAPDDQEKRKSRRSRRRKCRDSTDGKKSVLSKPAQRCFPDEQTYGRWKSACVELQDKKENKQVVREIEDMMTLMH